MNREPDSTKSLGDFLSQQLGRALKGAESADMSQSAVGAMTVAAEPAFSPRERQQLATQIVRHTATEGFAAAVNEAVPPPEPGESEDQFVQRAKAAIRELLLAKFGR
jgi:hypothetical protein